MFAIGRITLAGMALWGLLPSSDQDSQPSKLDHPALARAFLEENKLADWADAGPTSHGFDEFLDGPAMARIEVGALELRIPVAALAEAEVAEDFRSAVATTLDVQASWFEWQAPARAESMAEDWKILSKWVKGWTKTKLARVAGGQSLYQALAAGEMVNAAAERLAQATLTDPATSKALGERGRILFAPSRRAFFQTLALAAWWDEKLRATFWSDAVLQRTVEWVGWNQIVCMEYTTLPFDPGNPFLGVDMNADDKSGLAQYMSERAAALLLRREFWHQDAHFFEQALATNLVIASTGKNNLYAGEWKLEMRTSGSTTQPYSRFVPGGNPAGGVLPPNKAGPGTTSGSATEISLYRSSGGADYFLGPLREGQVAGAKLVARDKKRRLADERHAHFALQDFLNGGDHAVTAPFLGEVAEKGTELPPLEFLDDYEDFFRAYRAGFLFWLQTEAGPSPVESRAKFAELLAAHAQRPQRGLIDVSIEKIYAQPISAPEPTSTSLEWRYLAWLAKRK